MISPTFDLSTLGGDTGFTIEAGTAGVLPRFGQSIAFAGDINGDGIGDILVGEYGDYPRGGERPTGASYVIFGTEAPRSNFVAASVDGTNGFRIVGEDSGDNSGSEVAGIGDFNGDGFDDLLIGAPNARHSDGIGRNAGQSHIVFGTDQRFAAELQLSDLSAADGVRINGAFGATSAVRNDPAAIGDLSGRAVSSAGDFNGDGINDILIGAPGASGARGAAYVIYGTQTPTGDISLADFPGSLGSLADLPSSLAATFSGIVPNAGSTLGDGVGVNVAPVGDFNGDGFDDVLIGANAARRDNAEIFGAGYIVFGNATGFDTSLRLEELDGSNGIILEGIFDEQRSTPWRISSAGDFNGDGLDDVLIAAPTSDVNGVDESGIIHVLFGSDSLSDRSVDLSQMDANSGLTIVGDESFELLGLAATSAGDLNNDGFGDIAFNRSDPATQGLWGSVFVIYGSASSHREDIDIDALSATDGFRMDGVNTYDLLNINMSAGDVNGDSIDDLMIGDTTGYSFGSQGGAYVIFGQNRAPEARDDEATTNKISVLRGNLLSDNGSGADLDDSPNPLIRVVAVDGQSASVGTAVTLVSGASLRINSDGTFSYDPTAAFADLANGTTATDTFTYTITDRAGSSQPVDPDFTDTARVTVIIDGTTGFEGTAGSDVIERDARSETIAGLAGFDWIIPGRGDDTVDGGADRDMISYSDIITDVPGRGGAFMVDLDLGGGTVNVFGGEMDQLTSIERATGSIFADVLRGTDGNDELRGIGDYDWFVATLGQDTLNGGNGLDMITFLEAQSSGAPVVQDIFATDGVPPTGAAVGGVLLDLADGTNNTGLAAGLTLISVERVTGSSHQDVFFGDGEQNDFRGLGGFDWFVSSTGGRERYFGGDGVDTVTYFNAGAGVIASLRNGAGEFGGQETGFGSAGDAIRDLYFEIENLVGSDFDDRLEGNRERNDLVGRDGDDYLLGYGNIDYLKGGLGNDTLDGGAGSDFALFDGNRGDYTLTRTSSTEVTIVGADGTDSLINVEYFQFDDQTANIWELSVA